MNRIYLLPPLLFLIIILLPSVIGIDPTPTTLLLQAKNTKTVENEILYMILEISAYFGLKFHLNAIKAKKSSRQDWTSDKIINGGDGGSRTHDLYDANVPL